MTFKKQIDAAMEKKVGGLLEDVVRKVSLDLQAEISEQTPVDTGRARSNWFVSINVPSGEVTERKNGVKVESLNEFRLSDVILVTNNLPYIRRLNDGHSQQAPSGFVDRVIMRQVNKVNQIARAIANDLR